MISSCHLKLRSPFRKRLPHAVRRAIFQASPPGAGTSGTGPKIWRIEGTKWSHELSSWRWHLWRFHVPNRLTFPDVTMPVALVRAVPPEYPLVPGFQLRQHRSTRRLAASHGTHWTAKCPAAQQLSLIKIDAASLQMA